MGTFLDEYKILDEVCKVLLDSEVGVTEYINVMKEVPDKYSLQIDGWEDDLKKLKHYRYIRNKIVHEVGENEEDHCTITDCEWLKNFYNRIKEEQDPLSFYYRIIKEEIKKKEKNKLPLWGKILIGGSTLACAIGSIIAAVLSKKDK